MGSCVSQPTAPTPVSRYISRSTQTPQLEIEHQPLTLPEQNRNGNLIERVAQLEQSHKELSVTVTVLLSEVAKVRKDTLKNKKD